MNQDSVINTYKLLKKEGLWKSKDVFTNIGSLNKRIGEARREKDNTLLQKLLKALKILEHSPATFDYMVKEYKKIIKTNKISKSKSKTVSIKKRQSKKRTSRPKKLKPCPEGKERNPKTNRCKKVTQEEDKFFNFDKYYKTKTCPEGKERNMSTNRCRKTCPTERSKSSSRCLKPCKEGKVRNSTTNRCKSPKAYVRKPLV